MADEIIYQKLELNPPMNVTFITDESGLDELDIWFQDVKQKGGILGWDVETTPVKDFFNRRCRTIQFGDKDKQYVIDLLAFADSNPITLDEAQGHYGSKLTPRLKSLIQRLQPILGTNDFLKVGVNLAFEYSIFYWNFGLRCWNFFSCDNVERVLVAGAHSLKDYGYFSMEEMMQRYFQRQIDKTLQTSFNLVDPLSEDQIHYAALDTRLPLGLRTYQTRILLKDKLVKTAQIENDAIGAFVDMHIHGENLNTAQWNARVDKFVAKKIELLKELDEFFIPIVGLKTETITEEELAKDKEEWKRFNQVTPRELELKALAKKETNLEQKLLYLNEKDFIEKARKEAKEHLKAKASEKSKRRTKLMNLIEDCEGQALINYGSQAQMLPVLKGIKGLKGLTDTNDDTMAKFKDHPVIQVLRKFREVSKVVDTYGYAWTQKWTTKPCNEEGWLNPGDGRLHCTFNQQDAETGRSSSEKPNGQNLEQDEEVRSCFQADPPNENIRVSVCCDADTLQIIGNQVDPELEGKYRCLNCNTVCDTKAEEYDIVTADMSGAELRIIAEEAQAKSWIEAFDRDEDVHSVGTELLYPELWPKLAIINGEVKGKPYSCEYYKLHTEATVAKNPKCVIGTPMRLKCNCPEHKKLRDGNKATNFLLAYGGTAFTLAQRIGTTQDEAQELMNKHEKTFPDIWIYLEDSGQRAFKEEESRDMFGRRRILRKPAPEQCQALAKVRSEKWLRFPKEKAKLHVDKFLEMHGRKPNKEELWMLTHKMPDQRQIASAYMGICEGIRRQGKNHRIQGTNASIAKLSMGCGYDEVENKPYLWHTLPMYRAKLIKFVHDELVVQSPKQHSRKVAELIGDAFRRAGAERMKRVVMKFEFNIAPYWKK